MKAVDKSRYCRIGCDLETEIKVLSSVRHPQIVMFYEALQESDWDLCFLVMELVKGIDLFYVLKDQGHFTEERSRILTSDLASALSYLHSIGIVHRDVKPENLIVSR